jgi:hypothetical protein
VLAEIELPEDAPTIDLDDPDVQEAATMLGLNW